MKDITSIHHPLVRHWQKLKENGTYRRQENSVLLEGRNAIEDVCAKVSAKRIIALSPTFVTPTILTEEVVIVSEQIIKKIASVESSDGIIAELSLPAQGDLKGKNRILVFDRLQDPGNVGTLIRTALAFGWEGLFLIQGSCDPFNDKALRSSKGASFFFPIQKGTWEELSELIKKENLELVVADADGEDPSHFSKGKKMALVLGNEAQGAIVPLTHRKVALAMPGPVESLNVAVAGSILMYML